MEYVPMPQADTGTVIERVTENSGEEARGTVINPPLPTVRPGAACGPRSTDRWTMTDPPPIEERDCVTRAGVFEALTHRSDLQTDRDETYQHNKTSPIISESSETGL